jgi:hypothetical protein
LLSILGAFAKLQKATTGYHVYVLKDMGGEGNAFPKLTDSLAVELESDEL